MWEKGVKDDLKTLGLSQWKDERPHIDFPPLRKGMNLYTSQMETLKEPPSWHWASPSEALALQATGRICRASPATARRLARGSTSPPPRFAQKTKEHLIKSEDNLRLANNKAEDLSIKKLTHNSETMAKMFDELNSGELDD